MRVSQAVTDTYLAVRGATVFSQQETVSLVGLNFGNLQIPWSLGLLSFAPF